MCQEFTITDDTGNLTLVQDDGARLEVHAAAGGAPIPGFECQVYDQSNRMSLGKLIGNSEGVAVLEGFQEGTYAVRILAPRILLGPYTIRASQSGENFSSCRRLGALNVLVLLDGTPTQGAQLSLLCASSGSTLSSWMQAGIVATCALLSDSTGRISVPELPEGEFAWRIDLPGGEFREGRIAVGVTAATELTIE